MAIDEKTTGQAERAVQQVIATAVKHQALEVVVELVGDTTVAVFRFENDPANTVELSLAPDAFAGALMARIQPTSRYGSTLTGVLRTEFKSVCVDCDVRFKNVADIGTRSTLGASASASRRSVTLGRFQLDSPENPLLWLGLRDDGELLRSVLDEKSGVLCVVSKSHATRNLALRSIRDAFPSVEVIPLVPELNAELTLFTRCSDRLVVCGIDSSDIFDTLELILSFPESQRASVRGILAIEQLARNCFFCSAESIPPRDLADRFNAQIPGISKHVMRGRGCPVCEQKGVIGSSIVGTVVNLDGATGEFLRTGAPSSEIYRVFETTNVRSVFERAAEQAMRGDIPLESLGTLSLPPQSYCVQVQQNPDIVHREVAAPIAAIDFFAEGSSPASDGAPTSDGAKAPVSTDLNQPLRGAGAFLGRALEKKSSSDAPQNSIPAKDAPPKNEKLILVIEDDPDQRAILVRLFESSGYEVETAASGLEGIVSAQRTVPALIVVDYQLPGIDGAETIRRLRASEQEKGGHAAILAFTVQEDPEVEYQMLEAGADEFCTKTVSKKILLKRIEKLFARV